MAETLRVLLKWLDGKKTTLSVLFTAAAVWGKLAGWLPNPVADVLITAFGTGTVLALRHSVKKVTREPDVFGE